MCVLAIYILSIKGTGWHGFKRCKLFSWFAVKEARVIKNCLQPLVLEHVVQTCEDGVYYAFAKALQRNATRKKQQAHLFVTSTRCFRTTKQNASRAKAAIYLFAVRCRSRASRVFLSNIAMVMGPTPPGTGVI